MFRFGACTWAVLGLVCGSAFGDQIGYASSVGGGLYSVDLTTATATLLGNTGITLLEGLAISPSGVLYGTDSNGSLYSIARSNYAATLIGSTAQQDIEGLDFNGSTLLGTNFSSGSTTVFSINTSNANVTPQTTTSAGVVRALAVENSTTAYLVAGLQGSEVLDSLNLTTGATMAIGALNDSSNLITSLDMGTDGNLYALDSSGEDYLVNPTTAALTSIGNTGNQFYLDLTIPTETTTPEPATALLLAAAGIVLAALRRTKFRSYFEVAKRPTPNRRVLQVS